VLATENLIHRLALDPSACTDAVLGGAPLRATNSTCLEVCTVLAEERLCLWISQFRFDHRETVESHRPHVGTYAHRRLQK
jgi:hypothetical protein